MRLTIFDNPQIPILWQNSLNKLITPYNYDDLLKLGDVHLAVFNNGVVGISITYQNTIRFIKVRDITRRRGVGRYLIQQTEKFIQSNVYNSVNQINIICPFSVKKFSHKLELLFSWVYTPQEV